jgi:hypothetical protein
VEKKKEKEGSGLRKTRYLALKTKQKRKTDLKGKWLVKESDVN